MKTRLLKRILKAEELGMDISSLDVVVPVYKGHNADLHFSQRCSLVKKYEESVESVKILTVDPEKTCPLCTFLAWDASFNALVRNASDIGDIGLKAEGLQKSLENASTLFLQSCLETFKGYISRLNYLDSKSHFKGKVAAEELVYQIEQIMQKVQETLLSSANQEKLKKKIAVEVLSIEMNTDLDLLPLREWYEYLNGSKRTYFLLYKAWAKKVHKDDEALLAGILKGIEKVDPFVEDPSEVALYLHTKWKKLVEKKLLEESNQVVALNKWSLNAEGKNFVSTYNSISSESAFLLVTQPHVIKWLKMQSYDFLKSPTHTIQELGKKEDLDMNVIETALMLWESGDNETLGNFKTAHEAAKSIHQ